MLVQVRMASIPAIVVGEQERPLPFRRMFRTTNRVSGDLNLRCRSATMNPMSSTKLAPLLLSVSLGLIAIGVPCWLALQARGIHQWWAAFALGAVLGTAAGCALIWAAQFIYLGDSCAAFHACTEPTALNRVIEIGKTATLVAVIPGLTGLLIWRLTRARPVLTP